MTAATAVTGTARVGTTAHDVAHRLGPGEIAVIDVEDLDAKAAGALLAARPAAVVNAGRTMSGRLPVTGALALLEAGVPVIDRASAATEVRDGATVTLADGDVLVDGDVVAAGRVLERDAVRAEVSAAVADLPVRIASLSSRAFDLLESEAALLLDGAGLPRLRLPVEGRAVVVVGPRFVGASSALSRFVRERRPLVIAVGAGVTSAVAAGLAPRIVLGDIDAVPEDALRKAAQVIVHDPVGRGAGGARAQAMGLAHDAVAAPLASEDLAVLAAERAGAAVVVVAGARAGVVEHLEDPWGAGAVLTRLVAERRVVDAEALGALYRHAYSGWASWGAVGLGAVALALAVWGTPEGNDALGQAWSWLTDAVGGGR